MKTYIGLDNGVTGTIGIIREDSVQFLKVPVKKEQNYTKAKNNITRVDIDKFIDLLSQYKPSETFVLIERPMVNPQRFKATTSALRCLEAELVSIEHLKIPFQYCDSKEWQKMLLPKGVKDTKEASLDIGNRLFPQFREFSHPDRDGLLIAEYARRKNF